MRLGIEVLCEDLKSNGPLSKQLGDRRLALLAHPASIARRQASARPAEWIHSMDALLACARPGQVCAAFGPQHGLRGERQDNMQETPDDFDPHWKLPVFSLYGEVRRPTASMCQHFDVLLIDLQDVGTRIYTYLTTLLYALEAGAKFHKEIWILDRPNPAGREIEGTLLRPGWVSFVGAAEGLPMRHGLTLGEAAHWFVKKLKLDVKYQVVKMQDYRPLASPGHGWPLGEIPWVNPSPNAASLSMARAFPGTVLLEGTELSEGRGTTRPLETMGGPGLDLPAIRQQMQRLAPDWMRGAWVRDVWFMPTFHKHQGQIIPGFQIHCDHDDYDPQLFKPYRLVSLWLKCIRLVHPEYKIWRDFHYEYERDRLAIDLINGGPELREWVDANRAEVDSFERLCARDEKIWANERELLYDF